jgi:hypothetical protein
MDLLRTDSFNQLEDSIKRNALRNLGFDPAVDLDKLDLYFTPPDTFDFYKSLDLIVKEGQSTVKLSRSPPGAHAGFIVICQPFFMFCVPADG